MTRRLILYALFCLALLAAALFAAFNAWSFYSDEEDRPVASGHVGPTHK
ncbi:hypothetical protein [Novosphingobium sp. ERW19]|nr:hypothetical protein [Novosphingobium sp. ERW19]NLR40679.1 hypothetical protein [Novosphingobium sp. ERW19]